MATQPDNDLAVFLDTNVGALTSGTNLFRGFPRGVDTGIPDQCVFCLVSGGQAPDPFVAGGTGDEQRYSEVMIRVRSNPHDFQGGQTLARSVRNAVHHKVIAGYINVEVRESDPMFLGETEKGHSEWSIVVLMEHLE